MTTKIVCALGLFAAAVTLAACSGETPAPPAGQSAGAPSTAPAAATAADDDETLPPSEIETKLPPGVRDAMLSPFKGDLDDLVKRRLIRVGVVFSRTFYFVDRGMQRGIAADYARLLEERINTTLKTDNTNKVNVVLMALPREMLLSALVEGKVDMVAAHLTVRPELEKFVDFTNPTRMNVSQVLVTGPDSPAIASIADLSGKEVFAREGSSHYDSLVAASDKLKAQGKPPISVQTTPANLEEDDLLEMVSAGLMPAIVVDDYLAVFWKKVFPKLTVHTDIVLRTGGTLAVAVRKENPKLKAGLNKFMGNYGLGTPFGEQMERKYLVSTKYVKNATSEAERKKFQDLMAFFKKYSERYNLDFLLMAAQGYQESLLNQDARSQVGAIGVMQVMPATGKELNVGDITLTEANIHAGVKYMRTTMDAFFKDEPMDNLNKALFTFASYNAGPGRVRGLRKEAAKKGLNPNLWFGNVEQIAAERIGRETVTYVSNIYKYYIAYRLMADQMARQAAAKAGVKGK
jgi:membrane-bound lytic murein transglycosylase MltF